MIIQLIDDERNDIFIHVDGKSKNVPFQRIQQAAKRTRIFINQRIWTRRLTYDLYDVTLELLKFAQKEGDYAYYHLITGQDLPIKDQDYVHAFFERNAGKNFIDVVPLERMKDDWRERVSLYHFFSPWLTPTSRWYYPAKVVDKISLSIQRFLGVNRLRKYEKKGYQLRYGSGWMSITREFAEYLLEEEEKVRTIFGKWTYIPEECIPQTLIWNSDFRDTVFDADWIDHDKKRSNLRMIFWTGKTSPEDITLKHVEELKNTPNIFARKFNWEKHRDAFDEVERMVREHSWSVAGSMTTDILE